MKRGDLFITKDARTIYKVVGYWGRDIVLADVNEEEDASKEVLIYSPAEIEELVGHGYLRELYKTGIKVAEVNK